MDSERIKGLIDLLAESDLLELSLTEGDSTVRLFRQAGAEQASTPSLAVPQEQPVPVAPEAAARADTPAVAALEVKASLYGVLHLTPAVGEPPFVAVGEQVEAGQTLAIIEAMKMFHPVKAKSAGRISAILVQGGAEVEAGQPLFRLG
ncbi:Biotin carboxyl carrier protein of acetyl-CoA carboxylase [Pseudomonas chlororaphis subsp. aurantiaca]|uniref:acetyl-CoA carboxylase biotin carboxyl carrier protein n=1 Tax=Pseudomonas chlororaphis TaxID=587753 RepID=UPI000F55057F|nr:acetyl-CoA carboxylase biotin carboxyl carrier protein subunit [Pseudomonas chlororaphis]AZD36972.1 Biotin carboxyl carrier protein of acetyl-CoA carboxylase [Pseudomonas chlororaphis subsp. aurantiaca]AZD43311.1 Biotin carboxyl carrier protein of acetyl-CoA carboxylase [Pseudomonas chlororaphis subsp. aurantiaca]AZD49554.1 Biotin carboxyl carrier protein of acetyl-CoA carboxylase [Pseudomonas chlororaphis subsp. aurantiaca]AZD80678.1 Biotin carboxyl carrier protein of acetyl-CoA carboxylase